ncbi:MAG TPA: polysaccharide deacetylase family protein [Anaeromyxobacter sp.]
MPERADDSARWILRRSVKAAFAGALTAVGAHALVHLVRRRQAGGSRVLILSYHRVTPDFGATSKEALASLLVSTASLRCQIEYVAHRHEIVSLADACRILAEPAGARVRDAVAITLDDGYVDNHDHALPVLASMKAPATVFVPTAYIGTERRLPHDRLFAALSAVRGRGIPFERAGIAPALQALLTASARPGPAGTLDVLIRRLRHPDLVALAGALEARLGTTERDLPPGTRLMSWEQVRALAAAGIDIGGHSMNHAVLANLPLQEARREIVGCRDQIADRLGRRPRFFAYPNGYYTPNIRAAVADAGFEAAVTIEDEENRRGIDPYGLKRKVLWENTTRGPLRYNPAVAACSVSGVFSVLGLVRPVPGERPNVVAEATLLSRASGGPPAGEGR